MDTAAGAVPATGRDPHGDATGAEALEDAFRGHRSIAYRPGGGWDDAAAAPALTEPDDMRIVASPCHDYEPVKVPEAEAGPFHCLVCGGAFAT